MLSSTAERTYRLNTATVATVPASTGITSARGSARIPPSVDACGASGGNTSHVSENTMISSSAKKKLGIA